MNQKNTATPKIEAAANLVDAIITQSQNPNKKPIVSGQCAEVLDLIRRLQPVLSFELTATHAIPEAAARVHDLRSLGFNVITTIVPEIIFRGVTRRKVAKYSLGSPEWPRPEFLQPDPVNGCLDLGAA